MAQEEVHDAGLALGLSLGGGGGDSSTAAHRSGSSRAARWEAPSMEPSLTLSMPDDTTTVTATATASGGGGHSVSSLSVGVKRERLEDAADLGEMVSSTAAAEDDDDGSTRKKLRLTKEQSALLEDRFKEHSTLNPKQKVALAKQLNLRPRQVEVWFQNRRARTKLKQTEVDCEFLKRCCETLTEENRRLQRELQELRALKFAPPPPTNASNSGPPPSSAASPFYMQLPAATLTICPSCERATAAGKVDPDRPKATHHFFNPFTHSAAC
ncbi:homeobox-leucine zipper protein HOX19-like [Lolium rigidum]|uniref:homeobox-leucine zipper protein HOX19-like n=1 Tax=Lolium rigidum TaxID=89674 RepID=UPI001F5C3841|nr:homeobox-leucine zipper protein HOX19-like [Lolium rigidum]